MQPANKGNRRHVPHKCWPAAYCCADWRAVRAASRAWPGPCQRVLVGAAPAGGLGRLQLLTQTDFNANTIANNAMLCYPRRGRPQGEHRNAPHRNAPHRNAPDARAGERVCRIIRATQQHMLLCWPRHDSCSGCRTVYLTRRDTLIIKTAQTIMTSAESSTVKPLKEVGKKPRPRPPALRPGPVTVRGRLM